MRPKAFKHWWSLCLLCCVLLAQDVIAQARVFPENSFLGVLEVTIAPEIRMNGSPARLAPGSLIRNLQNMVITPNELTSPVIVKYTLDVLGDVLYVWILSQDEFRRERANARRN
jgi:hypothetical protein